MATDPTAQPPPARSPNASPPRPAPTQPTDTARSASPGQRDPDAPAQNAEEEPANPPGETGPGAAAPPLPDEPVPGQPADDGWEYHWVPASGNYWFHNRFTGAWQQENPRVPTGGDGGGAAAGAAAGVAAVGGYNPAIHGDYDPDAWYARGAAGGEEEAGAVAEGAAAAAAAELQGGGLFNLHTGQWQDPGAGPERHGDEAKSRRQMNAFFDVDAAADAHGGRSLKAERSGKKPSKAELRAFKEKRKAKKEEKRRAWLRD